MLIWIWALAISACPVRLPAQIFTDNFGAHTFNPYWTVAQQQGGTVSLCTGQNHTPGGQQSACFSAHAVPGQKNLALQRQFASPAQGDFSIWFYDSGELYSDQTNYNFFYLSNPSTGISASVGTVDFNPACCAAALSTPSGPSGPNAPCGPYPQATTTNVQRTVGWHEFEIDVTSNSLSIVIDGNQVLNASGSYSFTMLTLDMFGLEATSSTTYYDHFAQTLSAPVTPSAPT
jgi:hypothetical protein